MSTTDLSAPIELFGVNPGVSVIDTATVLTRQWYFDGKFLRAEGFRRDQQYVRSLVALSNQCVGHGLVHGFDVALAGSDRFRIEGGLALAPSGRIIHLPQQIELSIAEIIARSTGEFDPGAAPASGAADFSTCPPSAPLDPVMGLSSRPYYVLTVAPAEALCGEEERFGQLCEDACATETDRSVAVEGTRYRVRELQLVLPTSRLVSFTPVHHRSQVATAYFEAERHAVASMISGAGLKTPVWCRSAEGISGDEVALAVFDRTGSVTSWVDMWIARRELMETTPQRYWGWRMAQRPFDVFLAQVLQFQCQLVASGTGTLDPGIDPCAEERATLAEVNDVLATLMAAAPFPDDGDMATLRPFEAGAGTGAVNLGVFDRLSELRTRVAGALSGVLRSASGSLLVDAGFVTVPSFGYLVVNADQSVEAQVRALMGPGVDLRFCAVRPDFVPEAFFEAQHMERISLTQGIDDPGALEEVDVLVPGGEITPVVTSIEAFTGVIRLLPAVQKQATRVVKAGSALSLAAVARDHVQEGWSWSLAAQAEAPHQLGVADLMKGGLFDLAGMKDLPDEKMYLHIEEDAEHDMGMADAAFMYRTSRAKVMARERRERSAGFVDGNVVFTPDDPIPPDTKRPVSLWFDVTADRDLREVPIGDSAFFQGRVSLYSQARTNPVVFDVQLSGPMVVTGRSTTPAGGGGGQIVTITTQVNGFADALVIVGEQVVDPPPKPVSTAALVWTVGVTPTGVRVLSVHVDRQEVTAVGQFEDTGSLRHIEGVLDVRRRGHSVELVGDWESIATVDENGEAMVRLAALTLDEEAGALDPGSPGRDLGDAVIEIIGSELALRGRDPNFTPVARRRLFEPDRGSVGTISTSADWVAFHRRRTKTCGLVTEPPTAVRRIRWYHAVVSAADKLEQYSTMARRWATANPDDDGRAALRDRLDRLGFELVTTVEFPERATAPSSSTVVLRTAWSSRDRGERLLLGAAATPATGDGDDVALGRLLSTTSAVSDLIDATHMTTRVMGDIPPEFQAPGVDGAMFTVGLARREHTEGCAHIARVNHEAMERFLQVYGQKEEISFDELIALLTKFDDNVEFERISFVDGDFVNRDEIITWWGEGIPVDRFAVALDSGVVPGSTIAENWRRQTEIVQEILGFDRTAELNETKWALGDCQALYVLTRADG